MNESYRGKQVRVFRLDREGVIAHLRRAAARLIAEQEGVLVVRLFGSLARGEAAPGSDADLLIVVRNAEGRFLDRAAVFTRYFERAGVGCDVLVYTEAEVAELGRAPSIVKTAVDEGVVLAESARVEGS